VHLGVASGSVPARGGGHHPRRPEPPSARRHGCADHAGALEGRCTCHLATAARRGHGPPSYVRTVHPAVGAALEGREDALAADRGDPGTCGEPSREVPRDDPSGARTAARYLRDPPTAGRTGRRSGRTCAPDQRCRHAATGKSLGLAPAAARAGGRAGFQPPAQVRGQVLPDRTTTRSPQDNRGGAAEWSAGTGSQAVVAVAVGGSSGLSVQAASAQLASTCPTTRSPTSSTSTPTATHHRSPSRRVVRRRHAGTILGGGLVQHTEQGDRHHDRSGALDELDAKVERLVVRAGTGSGSTVVWQRGGEMVARLTLGQQGRISGGVAAQRWVVVRSTRLVCGSPRAATQTATCRRREAGRCRGRRVAARWPLRRRRHRLGRLGSRWRCWMMQWHVSGGRYDAGGKCSSGGWLPRRLAVFAPTKCPSAARHATARLALVANSTQRSGGRPRAVVPNSRGRRRPTSEERPDARGQARGRCSSRVWSRFSSVGVRRAAARVSSAWTVVMVGSGDAWPASHRRAAHVSV